MRLGSDLRDVNGYTAQEKFIGFFKNDSTGFLWGTLTFIVYLLTVLIFYWICYAIFISGNIKWFAEGTILLIVDLFVFLSLLIRFWGDVDFFKRGMDQFTRSINACISMGDYVIKLPGASLSAKSQLEIVNGIVDACCQLVVAKARDEIIRTDRIKNPTLRGRISSCIAEAGGMDPLLCNNTVEAMLVSMYEQLVMENQKLDFHGQTYMRQAINKFRDESTKLSVMRQSKGPYSIWFVSYVLLYISMLLHYALFTEELQIGGAIWSLIIYIFVASILIAVMDKSRNFWQNRYENVYAFIGTHDIETIALNSSRLFENFSLYTVNAGDLLGSFKKTTQYPV